MRWMQDFSFGARITHTYTDSEVEGFESRGANASLTMHRHTRLEVNAHAQLHTANWMLNSLHADTQTLALQSALKLHTSYWAALQSAGLMKRYHMLQ